RPLARRGLRKAAETFQARVARRARRVRILPIPRHDSLPVRACIRIAGPIIVSLSISRQTKVQQFGRRAHRLAPLRLAGAGRREPEHGRSLSWGVETGGLMISGYSRKPATSCDSGDLETSSDLDVGDPRVILALEDYLAALESGTKPDRREFLGRHQEIAE